MAENAVILALAKLASAFGDEGLNFGILSLLNVILTLTSLPNCMKSIERELLVMKGFLSQIQSKQFKDEAFNAWLGRVRKLACTIEDTIDEYIFLIHKQSGNGFFNFVKEVLKIPFVLFEMWSIALRLKRLNIELFRISQVRDRWVHMVNDELNMVSMHSYGGNINQSCFDDFVKDEELVGIEKNREKLVNLIQIKEKSLHVITVWGMGGLGKTTLVNDVYKREILTFDCHAWISISQSYNITDLLIKLIVQLFEEQNDQNPRDIHMMDYRTLKETLKMLLEHKCYLIVLDDVWTTNVYDKLHEFFPENGLGSRIIITTRINEVALLANEFCNLEIKALDEYDSYYLFCKKAFWKDIKFLCPPKLEEWARAFVKKCNGLPLALISIGSLLSRIEKTEIEWKRVYDQLNWELHNNPSLGNVKNILYLNFNDLPRYLKNCFLSCSMFPEDYTMKRSRIVRLWIGEGFIEERGSSKLEEIAEGYLTELLQRSLLQLVEKNSFGRVRLCKMHDIVRELAISLSRKECFHEVYDEDSGAPWGEFEYSFTRRLSVINSTNTIQSRDIIMPHLRSFIAFNINGFSPLILHFLFKKSRFLTVLDLQGSPIEIIPDSIGDLYNLRCLHLRHTNVKLLPESVSNLCNLQSLDLSATKIQKLPRGIGKLKNLRHLFAWRCIDNSYRCFGFCKPVNEIKGLFMLKNLQTLVAVEATEKLVLQLGNLTQLRFLCITNVRDRICVQLSECLRKLGLLMRLEIFARHEDEILQFENLNRLPPNLKKLHINARLAEETLDSPLFLAAAKNLKVIDFEWCQLEYNPFVSLSRLSWLTTMRLTRLYNGNKICFRAGWFPNMKIIMMKDFWNVDKVVFEEGALINLVSLKFIGFKELKDLPVGIKFLKSLEKLFLFELHEMFQLRWKKIDVLKFLPHISVLQIE